MSSSGVSCFSAPPALCYIKHVERLPESKTLKQKDIYKDTKILQILRLKKKKTKPTSAWLKCWTGFQSMKRLKETSQTTNSREFVPFMLEEAAQHNQRVSAIV